MKAKMWWAAAGLVVMVAAVPAVTPALGRTVVRIGVAPRFHFGPAARPLGFYGTRFVAVERGNYGSVDFNVEPQKSRLYVDGSYFGIADDFNGWPQTAKLPVGYHTVRVVAPDGRTDQRRIYVAAGRELDFNLKF